MSENDSMNEFTGTSIEEAIEAGLAAMDLAESEVEIEILDEGTKGLFGLGSKDARVRITPFAEKEAAAGSAGVDEPADRAGFRRHAEPALDPAGTDEYDEQAEVVAITRDTVIELLEKMHVAADVSAHMTPEDPHSQRSSVAVDITGDDLSILIGRKAETLDALQYITRLIVGKELNSSVIINIDVEGYRKRKEQRLRRIARSMARQTVETGRRQYLEPMSAAERRIIHMELRDHPEVYTESVGEGLRRKVTINLRD